MATNVKWYGDNFKRTINANYDKRLGVAGNALRRELRAVLSVPGRTITTRQTKTGKIRRKLGKLHSAPSAPGEAPAKQTGKLKKSVFRRVMRRKNRVRVGASGAVLRTGSEKINLKPRPFIEIAFARARGQITSILTTPLQ